MTLHCRPRIVILVLLALGCSVYCQEQNVNVVGHEDINETNTQDNSGDSNVNSTIYNGTQDFPPTTQEIPDRIDTTELVTTDEDTTQAVSEVMTTEVPTTPSLPPTTEPPPTTSPPPVDTTIPPSEER